MAPVAVNPPRREPLGLAIDTTFDDTSVAILRGRREVLADLTLSQFADHAEFGGVVPERASLVSRKRADPCTLLFVGSPWDRKGGPLACEVTAAPSLTICSWTWWFPEVCSCELYWKK